MNTLLHPWQLLLLILAGWINQREQDVIEHLRAENRVLREKLGKKRILIGALCSRIDQKIADASF